MSEEFVLEFLGFVGYRFAYGELAMGKLHGVLWRDDEEILSRWDILQGVEVVSINVLYDLGSVRVDKSLWDTSRWVVKVRFKGYLGAFLDLRRVCNMFGVFLGEDRMGADYLRMNLASFRRLYGLGILSVDFDNIPLAVRCYFYKSWNEGGRHITVKGNVSCEYRLGMAYPVLVCSKNAAGSKNGVRFLEGMSDLARMFLVRPVLEGLVGVMCDLGGVL